MLASKTALGLCISLSLAASSAFAEKKYDPGASDTEVKIGNAAPYSGPASSYGVSPRIIGAYFKMLNDQGGINGRKINYLSYDDQFSPPKTAEVTRRLVEQDEVLFVAGNMGSAANLAIRRYMNMKKVPHLFIAVGGSKFNEPKEYPWTMGFNPSYDGEGRLYARNILKTLPDAKIAVLYQNDDMGRDLLQGLKEGLGDKVSMIVAEKSYEMSDPTVDSQIVQLMASGANVFVNLSLSRAAAQAIRKVHELGWKLDQQYLIYNSASIKATLTPAGLDRAKGIITSSFYKDSVQDAWKDDPATKDYRAFMQQYAPKEDADNTTAVYGYSTAQAIAYVLEQAGDELTRENILKQASNLTDVSLPMLLPGITLNNSPTDYYPISSLQLVQFDGKEYIPMGLPSKLN